MPDQQPPKHEDTLAAIHGVPEDVAEHYADTGSTVASGGDVHFGTNKQPLSFFDNKSDEDILAEPGVGDATLKRIKKAQAKAAKAK